MSKPLLRGILTRHFFRGYDQKTGTARCGCLLSFHNLTSHIEAINKWADHVIDTYWQSMSPGKKE